MSSTGRGQIEINYGAEVGVAAADTAFVFKNTVKEYLAKQGLLATFMTKPYKGLSGSCAHYHVSLLQKETGANAFLDVNDGEGMSQDVQELHPGRARSCPGRHGDLESDAELLSAHSAAHLRAFQYFLGHPGPLRLRARQGEPGSIDPHGGARAGGDVESLSGSPPSPSARACSA